MELPLHQRHHAGAGLPPVLHPRGVFGPLDASNRLQPADGLVLGEWGLLRGGSGRGPRGPVPEGPDDQRADVHAPVVADAAGLGRGEVVAAEEVEQRAGGMAGRLSTGHSLKAAGRGLLLGAGRLGGGSALRPGPEPLLVLRKCRSTDDLLAEDPAVTANSEEIVKRSVVEGEIDAGPRRDGRHREQVQKALFGVRRAETLVVGRGGRCAEVVCCKAILVVEVVRRAIELTAWKP